eukprot:TRINITY_DN2066_c0_g1_i3.p1 TRINITY_DN2066_c0_g1~~TRINITY_DN2066_c0_g1_i3.p1  ORF type:complete len:311 (+),score=43.32 TRINITY_DN2066_c0_g1_i3:41-934(+)
MATGDQCDLALSVSGLGWLDGNYYRKGDFFEINSDYAATSAGLRLVKSPCKSTLRCNHVDQEQTDNKWAIVQQCRIAGTYNVGKSDGFSSGTTVVIRQDGPGSVVGMWDDGRPNFTGKMYAATFHDIGCWVKFNFPDRMKSNETAEFDFNADGARVMGPSHGHDIWTKVKTVSDTGLFAVCVEGCSDHWPASESVQMRFDVLRNADGTVPSHAHASATAKCCAKKFDLCTKCSDWMCGVSIGGVCPAFILPLQNSCCASQEVDPLGDVKCVCASLAPDRCSGDTESSFASEHKPLVV